MAVGNPFFTDPRVIECTPSSAAAELPQAAAALAGGAGLCGPGADSWAPQARAPCGPDGLRRCLYALFCHDNSLKRLQLTGNWFTLQRDLAAGARCSDYHPQLGSLDAPKSAPRIVSRSGGGKALTSAPKLLTAGGNSLIAAMGVVKVAFLPAFRRRARHQTQHLT